MDIRQTIILLSIIMLFLGLYRASAAGATLLDSFVVVNITKEAIHSGFTVKSFSKQLWIPIFPNQYEDEVKVVISDEQAPAELPENTQPVTGFFNFQIRKDEGTKITVIDKPVLLSFSMTSQSGFDKSVYYYDESAKKWQPLASKITDIKKNIIQAKMPSGNGHVVVLETLPKKWNSAAALVLDKKTGKIVYEKDKDEVRSIASLSKLMTVLVFLENKPTWNTTVTMKNADFVGGSTLLVNAGDKVTVKDLFYATLIGSKNNATMALVRSTGMTQAEFVKEMNKKAASMGLTKTKFVEPTGLDARNVSTAEELGKIAKAVFSNKDVRTASTQKYYQVATKNNGKLYWVKSTSKTILDRDLDVVATKTGVINASGYNLVTEAKNDRNELIALVLGAEEKMNYEEVYYLLKKYL